MNRLDRKMAELKGQNRAGLVTYFTGGDPDYDTTVELLANLGAAGADVIELGMPFSDPVADGPILQAANIRALQGGQTIERMMAMLREVRERDDETPIVLMGYFNPVRRYGTARFFADASASGADAIIIVDLPLEHAGPCRAQVEQAGMHLIAMTAPTSHDERLAALLKPASGFVYHIAIAGTTGAATPDASQIQEAVGRLRRQTDLPIAAGFGIKTAAQIREVAQFADLVVVGSRLVDVLAREGRDQALGEVASLAAALRPNAA
ncbi:tryptophan synthase subunit alpha [Thalassospira marina]|uniref:Tryptophan synthase alpha chain n=1 Tax=Thalassospira marina TaxID=2048283 RepID=A0ABN5FLH7_9PROT|nr:tryptophan synthase subunit alpha [Thalassospira marina]AUG54247.1 tryptophan synthase subunit alpha [Thalassospira marina]